MFAYTITVVPFLSADHNGLPLDHWNSLDSNSRKLHDVFSLWLQPTE